MKFMLLYPELFDVELEVEHPVRADHCSLFLKPILPHFHEEDL